MKLFSALTLLAASAEGKTYLSEDFSGKVRIFAYNISWILGRLSAVALASWVSAVNPVQLFSFMNMRAKCVFTKIVGSFHLAS